MERLLIILIAMVLTSCGMDPDDFKPEEEDGCKSTDLKCQADLKAQGLTTAEIEATWTPKLRLETVQGCVDVGVKAGESEAYATSFCACINAYIFKSFTYDQTVAEPSTIGEAAGEKVGGICQTQALEDEEAAKAESTNQGSTTVIVNNVITIGTSGQIIRSEEAKAKCASGKICRGLTKEDVKGILGTPARIETQDPFTAWEWFNTYSAPIQACAVYNCSILFRNGLVVDQKDIKGQYLDLENW